VTDEIIREFGDDLETITLTKGSSGRFEVSVNGKTIFSKAQEHRQARPGEIADLIRGRFAASGRDPARSTS
jgi:selT/selW/selH-like putative selenoprotein